MKRSIILCVLVAFVAGACGPNGASNMQEAGATADAKMETARPALATTGSQASDVAATVAAAAGKVGGTMGAEAGKAAGTVQAQLNERLVARLWQWVETTDAATGTIKPGDSSAYTVTFVPGGAVAVKADCKLASGTFTADETAMKFDVKVSTTDACPEGSLADKFIEQLGQVESWTVDGKNLTLGLANNGGAMHFAAP